jgi:WD40 repeat protein
LTKNNTPHGEPAWKIACAGQHIAVLAFAGVVFVWNSNNFVEVCNLHHLEPVTAICFNYKGNKFVTYGLRTTKLWSLPSGQLLSTTPNPADIKAMAVAFAENDKSIVAGCDDNKLRRITVDDFPGGWRALDIDLSKDTSRVDGGVMGSPMCLAFNGDATQVGVSYRGFPLSVWDMNEARCLSRCRRAKDFGSNQIRSAKNWFAVDRFTWNPMTGHIIGIYKDGCIFKWHPVTDENQEVQSAADEVAASSDGKLFVTSNSNGTVRVWNFAFFSVIYQLSSADLVTGLVFSPDCRRFYDVRGCSLNAWESNSLIRFSEAEEPLSDSASESYSQAAVSQASEALIVQYEAVSTLASSSNNLYCVGNEEGIVELFDSHTGKGFELLRFLNFLSVSHLVWGDDGNHVAAADLGGEIMIKCLSKVNPTATTAMKECARPIVDLAERGIHQLLFSRNSALLLVISEELGQIVSVDQGDLKSSAILSRGSTRKWLNHPTRKDLFLGFGGHDIKLFRWDDFSEFACLDFMEGHPRLDSQTSLNSRPVETLEAQLSSLNPSDDDGSVSSVSKAIITQDGRHLLVQIKESSTRGEISKRLLVFKSSTLEVPENWKAFGPLISAYIPPPVVALAETPLGVLDDSRLVFLDQDLWVCTFKLGITYDGGALKRHYFIPRDWMSTDGLELCCMMPDGTLLCPRDDKVAVIRGSLETGDF